MLREIVQNVYNVSVIDYNLRKFHGPSFSVSNGTSYNAYIIDDNDVTLIDIVEVDFFDDYIDQVLEVTGGREPKNLIINHTEPDHSGSFLKIIEMYPDINIYCTQKASEFINAMYDYNIDNFNIVKTNDTLNIGLFNLKFVEMFMLHWPDSMATYLEEHKLLFSNDAFGQHIASNKAYDYEHDNCFEAAKIYYANIIMPMASILKKKLDEIKDYEIEIIAPSHGVIWKKYVAEIIEEYNKWATFEANNKVVIVYDTMWGTTEKMAMYLARIFRECEIDVKLYKYSISEVNEIVTEIIDAKAIIVGSPTIYGTMLPNLAYLFEEMRVLKPKNKIGASFGSYGWASASYRRIETLMQELKIEVVSNSVQTHFKLREEQQKELEKLAHDVIDRMKNES